MSCSLHLLTPTLVAGAITLGVMQQIMNAFLEVRTSFQYFVNSWSTIVELISIYKRLLGFEATIYDEPLPSIETRPRRVTAGPLTAPSSPWSRAG